MKLQQRTSSRGFTLLEFVIVITLTAALAAIALPKLTDVGADAHAGAVDGTYGAFVVGVNLARVHWVAEGMRLDVDDLEGFGEGNVNVSDDGWPVGVSGDGNSSNMTAFRCVEVWRAVLIEQAPSVAVDPGAEYHVTTADSSTCRYAYQGSDHGALGFNYDASTGLVNKF